MRNYALTLALMLLCCNLSAQSVQREADSHAIAKVDRAAERMKHHILNSATDVKPLGAVYYVSAEGDDANDGLSPQTPLRTLAKVNVLELKPSDGVMFRRGDVWRGSISTREGVTYSAYGRGAKPRIYGSPCDAAVEGRWVATDTPNVYMYDGEISSDVGTLVFNGGEAGCAFKVIKVLRNGLPALHIETGEVFESYRDLKRDLDLYHDYRGAKRIYLCSTEGNPSERFSSIELLTHGHIIYGNNGVHIDNLCLKYCGSHAIGSGTTKGLKVTNCEIGWIGGSIQFENPTGAPTRFGNAVEIYGGCEDFTIDNCYVYQVYDAALTHQHQGDTQELLTMKNVSYTRCLVEDCVYAIEYFLGREDTLKEHYMLNVRFERNILRRAGMGWGSQRPDKITPAIIKSWSHHNNRAFNYHIRRNIFDRSTFDLLNIGYRDSYSAPQMERNTYIQYLNADGGHLGQERTLYRYDEAFPAVMERIFGERKGKYIFIEK